MEYGLHPTQDNTQTTDIRADERQADIRDSHSSTSSRLSHRRSLSLTSHDSSVFNVNESYYESLENFIQPEVAAPHRMSRDQAEIPVTPEEDEREIDRLRDSLHSTPAKSHRQHRNRELAEAWQGARDTLLDELLVEIRVLQNRVNRMEATSHAQRISKYNSNVTEY